MNARDFLIDWSQSQQSKHQPQGYDPNSIVIKLSSIYALLSEKKFIMTTEQLIATLMFTSTVFIYLIVTWRSALLMTMFTLYAILFAVLLLFLTSKICNRHVTREYTLRKLLKGHEGFMSPQQWQQCRGRVNAPNNETKTVSTSSVANNTDETYANGMMVEAKNQAINSSASNSENAVKPFGIDPCKLKKLKSALALLK